MRYSCRRGFTLLEIMTVSAVSVIILGPLLVFMTRGFQTVHSGEKAIELQQELNQAQLLITDDLRESSPSQINLPADGLWYNLGAFNVPAQPPQPPSVTNAGKIIWTNNWGVVYALNVNSLTRTRAGQTMVVANSLTRAQFRRPGANPRQVEVILSARDLTPFTQMQDSILFNVTMRN